MDEYSIIMFVNIELLTGFVAAIREFWTSYSLFRLVYYSVITKVDIGILSEILKTHFMKNRALESI